MLLEHKSVSDVAQQHLALLFTDSFNEDETFTSKLGNHNNNIFSPRPENKYSY